MSKREPAIKGHFDTPTARELRMFELALKIATDSDCSDRHGSVIAKGRRVVSVATNRFVTHPISDLWLKTSVHAEQRALIRAGSRSRRATLYCARDHFNLISMPCAMCFDLLQEAGIARVIFHDQHRVVGYDLPYALPQRPQRHAA